MKGRRTELAAIIALAVEGAQMLGWTDFMPEGQADSFVVMVGIVAVIFLARRARRVEDRAAEAAGVGGMATEASNAALQQIAGLRQDVSEALGAVGYQRRAARGEGQGT